MVDTEQGIQKRVDERISIVSDLHLSGVADSGSAEFESFNHDAAFARFIDDMVSRADQDNCPLRLVILGDFVDFPRTRLRAPRDDTGDHLAYARLRRVIDSHQAVFGALTRLVHSGHRIDILPGNHDLELMRPCVTDGLRRALGGSAATVRVHRWLLHTEGVFYAEHGNQYHDINSFPELVEAKHLPPAAWKLPIGVQLDETLLDLAEHISPASMTGSRPLLSMLRAAPKRPLSMLACGPRAIRFGVQAAVQVGGLVAGQSAARNAYRARALPAVAEETGLPLEALAAIDRLAEEVAAKLPRRVRRLAAGRLRRNGRGSLRASDGRRERASYLPLVASRISRILRQSQSYVPLLVFGHTHYGDDVPLDDDGFNTRYLNSGSWLIQDDRGQPVFGFVEINVASGHQVSGHLYRWDDVEGRVKPFGRA